MKTVTNTFAALWFLTALTTTATYAGPQEGACCMGNGMCLELIEPLCDMLDGEFQGEGTDCDDITCPFFGACCFADLACMPLSEADCISVAGNYQGNGVDCEPTTCPVIGACCLPNGSCENRTHDECVAIAGIYQGFGTDCSGGIAGIGCGNGEACGGACSFENGTCQDGTSADGCAAAGGNFLGDGKQCIEFNHPALGYVKTYDFNQNNLDDPETVLIPQFDETAGDRVLQRVIVQLDGAIHAVVTLTNLSEVVVDADVSVFENLDVLFAAVSPAPLVVIDEPLQVISCTPLELPPGATCDFDSPLSFCAPPIAPIILTGTDVDPFVGVGSLPAFAVGDGIFGFDGSQFELVQLPHRVEGKIQVIYEYTVVLDKACCFPGGLCEVKEPRDCKTMGGMPQTEDDCSDTLCPRACCLGPGMCIEKKPSECTAMQGDPQTLGTTCADEPCEPLTGACCFDDGSCDVKSQAVCNSMGGYYQGNDSICEPGLCPQPKGACCFPDGACAVRTQEDCAALAGRYQGDFTTCDQGLCLRPEGACCFVDGTCLLLRQDVCNGQGGNYQGAGVQCSPDLCPAPKGACCFPTGICAVMEQTACTNLGGDYQGDFSVCSPGLCPPPDGACCLPNGDCTVVPQDDCLIAGGNYQGDLTACSPGLCPDPDGACCLITGVCIEVSEEQCEAIPGVYYGDGSVCTPDLCPRRGACCLADGSCEVKTEDECMSAGGAYNGDNTECTPESCPAACCMDDGTCVVTSIGDCEDDGGVFQGSGTDCDSTPCPGACCINVPPPPPFDCEGKIQTLVMEWDGDEAVDIVAYEGDTNDPVLVEIDDIQPGDVVTVDGYDPGGGDNDVYWEIFEAGTSNLIGESKFHRSCSDDEMDGPEDCGNNEGNGKSNEAGLINDWLLRGLVDGDGVVLDCGGSGGRDECIDGLSLEECSVEGGVYQGFGTECAEVDCVVFGGDCCADGKPRVLTMRYTGDDCSATQHSQDPDKVDCDDYDTLGARVYILSTDDEDPFDGGAKVWFSGDVNMGDSYDIDAANAGEDKLKSKTFVHIFDEQGGDRLQSVEFHTSCSQPLFTGNQFGANLLTGCVGEDEAPPGGAGVPAPPKTVAGDVTGDGAVTFDDLLAVMAAWGPCLGCPEDLDGSGAVSFTDLTIVLSNLD